MSNLELSLAKSCGSYRNCIDIIVGIHKKGIHPKDQTKIREHINKQVLKEELYETIIKESLAVNKILTIEFYSILLYLKGPIHLETFQNLFKVGKTQN